MLIIQLYFYRLEDEGEVSLNLKDELHHKCKVSKRSIIKIYKLYDVFKWDKLIAKFETLKEILCSAAIKPRSHLRYFSCDSNAICAQFKDILSLARSG